MEKHQKNHFWNFALFTKFNLHMYVCNAFANLNVPAACHGGFGAPGSFHTIQLPRLRCTIHFDSIKPGSDLHVTQKSKVHP